MMLVMIENEMWQRFMMPRVHRVLISTADRGSSTPRTDRKLKARASRIRAAAMGTSTSTSRKTRRVISANWKGTPAK